MAPAVAQGGEVAATLHPVDLAVLFAYFAVVVAIGWWVARHTEDDEDLFLAGRSLGWGVIGASLFASNISSTTLIGLTGSAYTHGIAVANYEWMAGLVLVVVAVVLVPVYLRTRVDTVPGWLELRFGRGARLYFSAITIFLSIVVDTAGGLYAGALVFEAYLPSLQIWQTCLAIALFAGVYTAAGGLRAVVLTDVLQAVVLLVGSTCIAVYVFAAYDFSWTAVTEAVPYDKRSLIRPLDDPQLPWLGTLTGVPILGFWYWATNQYITQRILGARSEDHARWGATLGGFLKLLPLFVMVLPGAMAVVVLPEVDNADQVFPLLVGTLLPPGVTGLVLAGLVAAIMSSVDSTLNSASTLLVKDFGVGARHADEPGGLLGAGRWTTLALMAVAAAWAPMIASFPGLFTYLQQAFAIFVPPVVAIFLLGLFTHRGDGRVALTTLVAGHVLGVGFFAAAQAGVLHLHFTLVAGLATALSAALFLALARPRDDLAPDVAWRPDMAVPRPPGPWWRDYRTWAVASVVATAVSVVAFW